MFRAMPLPLVLWPIALQIGEPGAGRQRRTGTNANSQKNHVNQSTNEQKRRRRRWRGTSRFWMWRRGTVMKTPSLHRNCTGEPAWRSESLFCHLVQPQEDPSWCEHFICNKITFHPIPNHPIFISSHPIPSHIPSHPIPFHLIPSHLHPAIPKTSHREAKMFEKSTDAMGVIRIQMGFFIFTRVVVNQTSRVLPRFVITLRRVKKAFLWRDPNILNAENTALLSALKNINFYNLYPATTTEQAMDIINSKKNCTFHIITNGGNRGDEFVAKVRKAGVTTAIMGFCNTVGYHRKWAANYKDVEVTDNHERIVDFVRQIKGKHFSIGIDWQQADAKPT